MSGTGQRRDLLRRWPLPAARRHGVLVIGGSGFIGSHLVERLSAAGAPVRLASRRARWPWGEPPPGVEIAPLDLAHQDSSERLVGLLDGVGTVVNLAGRLARPAIPLQAYRTLHVEGARRVASAARASASSGRPVRLVHVSTTGVLGPTGSSPMGEASPPRPSTPYESTKLQGEQAALEERGEGLEVVVVRPGLVYGPRDLHLFSLFQSIFSGSFRLIGSGRARWQPIYVDDVVDAIQAAVTSAPSDGRVYHIAGAAQITVAELAGRIAARLKVSVKRPGLPHVAAMAAGAAFEAVCRPLGWNPPLSRARVRTLTQDRLYSIERAGKELGFAPRVGIDEGLSRTIAWYREQGLLP